MVQRSPVPSDALPRPRRVERARGRAAAVGAAAASARRRAWRRGGATGLDRLTAAHEAGQPLDDASFEPLVVGCVKTATRTTCAPPSACSAAAAGAGRGALRRADRRAPRERRTLARARRVLRALARRPPARRRCARCSSRSRTPARRAAGCAEARQVHGLRLGADDPRRSRSWRRPPPRPPISTRKCDAGSARRRRC